MKVGVPSWGASMIPELSVVAPATGGLPVAYGVCEALRARQVYWAEREKCDEPLHFRQYLEVQPGEKVLLVDDILRTGGKAGRIPELWDGRASQRIAAALREWLERAAPRLVA